MNLPKLVLASGSPRRAEILNAVGWKFEKQVADINEDQLESESPEDYVTRLAREKAIAVLHDLPDALDVLVLGADTTVVIDGMILGKPVDAADARRMLQLLSGRWHEVITGVALAQNGEIASAMQSTKVKFLEMNEAEIEYLIDFGAPLDKAGAYAVQAQAALFIEKIEGDYWNVVGLPVSLVYRLTQEILGVG